MSVEQLTEEQRYSLNTIEMIEENVHTNEFTSDLRELQIAADFRSGDITLQEASEKLVDLIVIQEEETWSSLQEEFTGNQQVLDFMDDYGYVPFQFELEG